MLDRIREKDKVCVQFYVTPETVQLIRSRAAEVNKTQSKYIADLVERESGAVAVRVARASLSADEFQAERGDGNAT